MNVPGSCGSLPPGWRDESSGQSCGPAWNWPRHGDGVGTVTSLAALPVHAAWPASRDFMGGFEWTVPKLPREVRNTMREKHQPA